MTTIAVLHTKGGVGKSTLAIQLALTRALDGRKVWLVDGDAQGTATQAIAQRTEAAREPTVTVSHYPDGNVLHAQVLQQAGKFDDAVLDVGGRDTGAMRAALAVADLVLVPCAPRSYDIWGAADIAAMVAKVVTDRPGLRVLTVLNQADARGSDNADAAAALMDMPPLEYLDCPVGRRKAIAMASADGMSVLELPHPDVKASAEILALTNAIFGD